MESLQLSEAAERKLTAAEHALVERYFAQQKKLEKMVSWGMPLGGIAIALVGASLRCQRFSI